MIEKKYGVIGKPLSHSLSPRLHNFWFKKNNLKASYSLIEIEKNQINDIINKIRTKELHGINVTVPYKKAVLPYLDIIINDAKATSSSPRAAAIWRIRSARKLKQMTASPDSMRFSPATVPITKGSTNSSPVSDS